MGAIKVKSAGLVMREIVRGIVAVCAWVISKRWD